MIQTQYELDLVANSYELHGEAYARKRLSGGMLFNDFIEGPAVRELLGNSRRLSGANVLDIGCGPGVYSNMLLGSGANVLGVDSSRVMLNSTMKYCQRLALPGKGNARFIHSTFELVDLGEERFDIVLATFMLSYFRDLSSAFSKMRDHLGSRGRIIASMLHPVRLFARGRSDSGYVVADYFSGGIYQADFLDDNSTLPLKRYNFGELFSAAEAAGLRISHLIEPRAQIGCGFPDGAKVDFYSRHPSVLVLQLTAR